MSTPPTSVPPHSAAHELLRPISSPRTALILGAAGMLVVLVFGLGVASERGESGMELGADGWFSALHVAPLLGLAAGINWLFSPTQALVIAVGVVTAVALVTRQWRTTSTFALVMTVSWLSNALVKKLVMRARPDPSAFLHPFLPQPSDYSYPSGHTAFAASLALALVLLARGSGRRRLVLAIITGALGTLVVAWSRIYLGVHYPSDVLAAILWVLSIGIVTFTLATWPASRSRPHTTPENVA